MSALELRSGHKLLGWITCWVGVSGGVSVFLMSAFELQSGHKLFRVDQMLGCWFGQRVFLMSAFELRSGHKLFGGLCLCLALAGWLCWLAGWAGWAGWLGWLGWLAGWLSVPGGEGDFLHTSTCFLMKMQCSTIQMAPQKHQIVNITKDNTAFLKPCNFMILALAEPPK